MKRLTKGSFWLGLLEQAVYIVPTLTTVLYYYFSTIREEISKSSQYTFLLSIVLFIFFVVYKKVCSNKIKELRQSVVQTETDLRNTPVSEVEKRTLLAENGKRDRQKLDLIDRGTLIVSFLIFALAVNILDKALIGISNLVCIAMGSILLGSGIHLGVLELEKKESIKLKGDKQ